LLIEKGYTRVEFGVAGSCQSVALQNPNFLPEKWAKTSVVIELQQYDNSLLGVPKQLLHALYQGRFIRGLRTCAPMTGVV
jgi:hypothetical protein